MDSHGPTRGRTLAHTRTLSEGEVVGLIGGPGDKPPNHLHPLIGGGVVGGPGYDGVAAGDPYPKRPTTAMKTRRNKELLEEAMLELDSPEYMPESCPTDIWGRMCQIRRSKIDSEQVLKGKGKGGKTGF